jgi:TPR repeat protein
MEFFGIGNSKVNSSNLPTQNHLALALEYIRNHQYDQALPYLEVLVEKSNNKWALITLGEMYLYGLGIPQDFKTANAYHEKAAENDPNFIGYYRLSVHYRFGLGVQQVDITADHFYQRANTTNCSINVEALKIDNLESVHTWLNEGNYSAAFVKLLELAHFKNTSARELLVTMCLEGKVTGDENLRIAIDFFKKAHKQGDPKAAFVVAKLIMAFPPHSLFGRSKENIDAALEWFQKAAQGANGADSYAGEAYYQMAMLMKEENIDVLAIPNILVKAFEQGHPTAFEELEKLRENYLSKTRWTVIPVTLGTCPHQGLKACDAAIKRIEQGKTEQKLQVEMHQKFELQDEFAQKLKEMEKISTDLHTLHDEEALFDSANAFIEKGHPEYAVTLLESLAQINHAKSHHLLGIMHMLGIGMKCNIAQAITHFKNAYEIGYDKAGFLLVDCYIKESSLSSLELAKQLIEKMVEDRLKLDKNKNQEKVMALFTPVPTFSNAVNNWYEISSFYLKAALKMARIRYLENPSIDNDISALVQEIISTADKDTLFELAEWYSTRSSSEDDKKIASTLLDSIGLTELPHTNVLNV